MASLLQDGYYKIVFVQTPAHDEDLIFINNLAEQLFVDFSSYINEPFVLKIGEFHCGRMEYTWQIEIQSTDQVTSISDINEKKLLRCVEASQYYFARNASKQVDNYSGRIEVAVTMEANHHQVGNIWYSKPAAKVLLRLAYMHYYEGIAKYYVDWETDYINAPRYFDRVVDTTNHWREYDAFDEVPKE